MKLGIKIICGILAVLAFGWLMNSFTQARVLKNFKIEPNKEIIVFGDSHAECSFWEKGTVTQNFGERSEMPNLTLLKYQKLSNKKLNKHIVLTLSLHNISDWRARQFFVNDSSGSKISKYWALVDNSFLLEHYSELPTKTRMLLHLKKLTGAPNSEASFKVKSSFIGGFYDGKDTSIVKEAEAKKAIKRHFGKANLNCKDSVATSQLLKKYYKDLVSNILKNNAKLYIVAPPLHKNYRNQVCEDYIYDYKMFLEELKNDFPNMSIMDFSNIELPDHYFLNPDHLNKVGATYFTKLIESKILRY